MKHFSIAIGSDHAGFKYKEAIKTMLLSEGHTVRDCGTYSEASCDYPDFCRPVAEAVARGEVERGIVLGGSGNGEAIVANRVRGVRCGLCWNEQVAIWNRSHNDGNCLSMPYAKGFGWAAELNLQDCYRKLFENERGVGYPKERAAIMAKNRGILRDLKTASCKDMLTVLKSVDQELLKATIAGEKFQALFFPNCQDDAIASYLQGVLNG